MKEHKQMRNASRGKGWEEFRREDRMKEIQ